MFACGETVMHPTTGVCRILDIRNEKFSGSYQTYYVLQPVYDGANSKVFVPVKSDKIVLRRLLDKAQINSILAQVPSAQDLWSADERERNERYAALLRSDDYAGIVKMIAQLHIYRETLREKGKKLHQSDERLLAQAQTLIHQEFSFALGLPEAETIRYIMKRIAA